MADTIESQMHFMRAIEYLNAAKLELVKATHHENPGSWDYVHQNINIAMLGILKRSRI